MISQSITAEAINAAFSRFSNSLSMQLKACMNGRLERGLQIAQSGGVALYTDPYKPSDRRLFKVNSSDPTKPAYLVDLNSRTCTCQDHWKGHYCKHRVAAQVYEIASSISTPKPPKTTETNLQEQTKSIGSEPIIWACLRFESKVIGVEVQGIEGNLVRVQALPVVTGEGKLEPQFPFLEGGCSTLVQAEDLFHVRVYRHG